MAIPKPKPQDHKVTPPGDHSTDTPRDPDQAWFWTEEWQASEREAEADLAAGRSKTFDTIEELLAELDSDDDD